MSDTHEDRDKNISPEKKQKKQRRQCKSYINEKKIQTKHHKKSKTFSDHTSISQNKHRDFKRELYKNNNYLRKLDSFENFEYDIPEKTNINININIAQTDKNANDNNENGQAKTCCECFMSLCMRLISLLVCIAIL
jgi:hypothetical protein